MATASPSILPAVNLNTNFSVTVTLEPSQYETISGVSGSLSGTPSEPITITSNGASVTISGKHVNTFSDVFSYTSAGESDLTETPTSVIGLGNVPEKKNLFNLVQDGRKSQIRTYNISYNGGSVSVTQEVLNPLEVKRQFMANYNYNGG